jgi:hypothetical protein
MRPWRRAPRHRDELAGGGAGRPGLRPMTSDLIRLRAQRTPCSNPVRTVLGACQVSSPTKAAPAPGIAASGPRMPSGWLALGVVPSVPSGAGAWRVCPPAGLGCRTAAPAPVLGCGSRTPRFPSPGQQQKSTLCGPGHALSAYIMKREIERETYPRRRNLCSAHRPLSLSPSLRGEGQGEGQQRVPPSSPRRRGSSSHRHGVPPPPGTAAYPRRLTPR